MVVAPSLIVLEASRSPRPRPSLACCRTGGGGATPAIAACAEHPAPRRHAPGPILAPAGPPLDCRGRGACSPTPAADVPLAHHNHPPATTPSHPSRTQAVASLTLRFAPSAGRVLHGPARLRRARTAASLLPEHHCRQGGTAMIADLNAYRCITLIRAGGQGRRTARCLSLPAPPARALRAGGAGKAGSTPRPGFRDGQGAADPRRRFREARG